MHSPNFFNKTKLKTAKEKQQLFNRSSSSPHQLNSFAAFNLLCREIKDHSLQQTLGTIEFHTYQPKCDKPYNVFIRGIHPTTDPNNISVELAQIKYEATRITNVKIKTNVSDKLKYHYYLYAELS